MRFLFGQKRLQVSCIEVIQTKIVSCVFIERSVYMPEVTNDKRFSRMLKFLIASSERPIAKILASRGFTDEDRKEGWVLLDEAAGRNQAPWPSTATFPTRYKGVVSAVDSFENEWFDVADAALKRQFPAVHAAVFQNLAKTSGSGVLLTVRVFLDRLDSLERDSGEESRKAMSLLEKRGLTGQRRAEARSLLTEVEVAGAPDDDDKESPEELEAIAAKREAAIKDMWEWYKDWAKTARTVVKNRNFRVMMGLSQPHGSKNMEDETAETF